MIMRRTPLRILIVLNILLAMAVLAHAGGSQIIPRILLKNCCEIDGVDEEYCCENCCLRLWDECQDKEDCEPTK